MSQVIQGSKNDLVAALQAAITGLQQSFKKKTLLLDGVEWDADDIVALFQQLIQQLNASNAARKAWLAATASQKATRAKALPVLQALRTYVTVTSGTASDVFRSFGIDARRKGKPSMQTAASAVQ